jgi:DNA-binding transcriptional MerR regulator
MRQKGEKSIKKRPVVSEKRNLLQIGAAAKAAGISRQSLQYYLMVGLLEPAEVTETGRRLFDKKNVDRIKLIKKLNESGYPLRAIRDLFLEGHPQSKGSL